MSVVDLPAFTRHLGFKGSYRKYTSVFEKVNLDSYTSNLSGSYLSEKQTVM